MARTQHQVKTYVKDGKERAAYSPADVVALEFDGWTEKSQTESVSPGRPAGGSSSKADGSSSKA